MDRYTTNRYVSMCPCRVYTSFYCSYTAAHMYKCCISGIIGELNIWQFVQTTVLVGF